MRNSNDVVRQQQNKNSQKGRAGGKGFLPSSFRTLSSYLRIVSSGASTVARSAVSVAQSIVDGEGDAGHDHVCCAGFDKLEDEGDVSRKVLLLGYLSGFQVWDVEEAHNVRDLVSRHDGPVSFMQMLPKPITSKTSGDKFADSRPLLVLCSDESLSGGSSNQDGLSAPHHGSISNNHDSTNCSLVPTVVRFFSLKSQSYVHVLKFRSIVHSVRCSSRIVAISQPAQIHCFDAATLEREYTILTNPVAMGSLGSGGVGYGPLAVGPRWVAYSGSPVVASNPGRVSPQNITPSASFPSNGSSVAHYAKESSKQLASGIVTLGDIGYKKLSRYCSELLPDHGSLQLGNPGLKGNGTANGHLPDADNIGMVLVRDIISKLVVAQFRAHKSPISALCFDPSGTILVTASVQGHNINVFKIMPGPPGSSSACGAGTCYAHLYRLQRGFTNAVIQDISFSDDSNWIMISSSRGTSHLFAINPCGGAVNFHSSDSSYTTKNGVMSKPTVHASHTIGWQMQNQQSLCASGPPVTLSAISRIRNGNSGWRGTVTGAAAATCRLSSFSGTIASSFHNFGGNNDVYVNGTSSKRKYHLLVFSPSGSMIQYAFWISPGGDSATTISEISTVYEAAVESDGKLVVEAIQKWNVCQKQNRREREDNVDIYGENSDANKIYPEEVRKADGIQSGGTAAAKSKTIPEEKHHLYISEAELQTHQTRMPFWTRPEVYFQPMITESIEKNEENSLQGEVEIERIPTRTIEARSKNLVPVFDYLQAPKFLHSRIPSLDSNLNGHLQQRMSGSSENGRLSRKSSSASLDSMSQSGGPDSNLPNGLQEIQWSSPRMPLGSRETVNINGSPETSSHLENVNTYRKSLGMEAQRKFVNNNSSSLKMEDDFEEDDG